MRRLSAYAASIYALPAAAHCAHDLLQQAYRATMCVHFSYSRVWLSCEAGHAQAMRYNYWCAHAVWMAVSAACRADLPSQALLHVLGMASNACHARCCTCAPMLSHAAVVCENTVQPSKHTVLSCRHAMNRPFLCAATTAHAPLLHTLHVTRCTCLCKQLSTAALLGCAGPASASHSKPRHTSTSMKVC